MNDLMIQDGGALTLSDSDRIRVAAAWEALSVNSRRSYQGAWDRCGQWLTNRGLSLDDLSDEVMAVYIATLDAEGRVLFVGDETVQVIEELKAKADISRGALFRRGLKSGTAGVAASSSVAATLQKMEI